MKSRTKAMIGGAIIGIATGGGALAAIKGARAAAKLQ